MLLGLLHNLLLLLLLLRSECWLSCVTVGTSRLTIMQNKVAIDTVSLDSIHLRLIGILGSLDPFSRIGHY